MQINHILDYRPYCSYFAFLLACVIVIFDKMHDFHNVPFIIVLLLLTCGSVLIQDNPGIMVLMIALFVEAMSQYHLKQNGQQ